MRPATREGAFDLVAEIIVRGLQRRHEDIRRQRNTADKTNGAPEDAVVVATTDPGRHSHSHG